MSRIIELNIKLNIELNIKLNIKNIVRKKQNTNKFRKNNLL